MTREEAIEFLNTDDYESKGYNDAVRMGIEALGEMSVEEYRQRLMELFHITDHDELLTYVVMPKEEEFKSLEYILRQYKYEPRLHGEWETAYLDHVSFGARPKVIYCSECQMVVSHKENFCEYCGADMREGEAREE